MSLRVRGAPAIGIAAAMGAYLHMKRAGNLAEERLAEEFEWARGYLASSRPTAVNLRWALDRMGRACRAALAEGGSSGAGRSHSSRLAERLRAEALAILEEDADACRRIGLHGARLLGPGAGVLTHCNAGALAASAYGTALAPVYEAHAAGLAPRVYAGETRPVLQGARLTAFELRRAGVDVTLICDSMAAHVMSKGLVSVVLVGCDRVAANGDTANKIGTLGLAVLASAFGVPFYVCCPASTIDAGAGHGGEIEIEERDPAEVTDLWYRERMAPAGVKAINPAFDVTPARLITGFVTETGITAPPFSGK